MNLILKLSGIFMLLSFSTLAGFLKSAKLKSRAVSLKEICISLKELKERIRLERYEINRLLKICFKDCLDLSSHPPFLKKEGLEKSDVTLFYEYLNNAGMADTQYECERLDLYIHLFEKRFTDAEDTYKRLGKLYRTCGFLIGLFVCIFII